MCMDLIHAVISTAQIKYSSLYVSLKYKEQRTIWGNLSFSKVDRVELYELTQ